MTDLNKRNLLNGAKALIVFLLALIAIITNSAVWNAAVKIDIDVFIIVVSVLNFVLEGTGIYFLCKKVLFKKD